MMRQVMRMLDDLLDQREDFAGISGASVAICGQLPFQSFEHEHETSKSLAQVIVQIKTNALPLALSNFQQFGFESPALLQQILQFEIGCLEVRSAFFDA